MSDCECRVIAKDLPGIVTFTRVEIVYCPLHEAASKLLEVAEGAYGWLASLPMESRPDSSWLKPLIDVIVSARSGHGWTHAICGPCWYDMGRTTSARHSVGIETIACCMCGKVGSDIVYYRSDPSRMPCKGESNG